MEEKTTKTVYKHLSFEKSGETLSVKIELCNVTPEKNSNSISGMLDILYADAKKAIFS